MRLLVRDLGTALREAAADATDVLDVYCGTRPYEDLLPAGARVVGLDVPGNPYGLADVVSDEFLPFDDASFDLVLCTQAFDYLPRPADAVAEFRRVLRPGGSVVLTVPLVWEYDRSALVHRFTGPQLAGLFDGWSEVRVRESGGRGVVWATLTGSLLQKLEARARRLPLLRPVVTAGFGGLYAVVNGLGLALEAVERRAGSGDQALPMNLLLRARRPDDH